MKLEKGSCSLLEKIANSELRRHKRGHALTGRHPCRLDSEAHRILPVSSGVDEGISTTELASNREGRTKMISSMTHSFSRRILARPDLLQSVAIAGGEVVTRSFGVASKGPHHDPLHLLQQECISRQLCDTEGNRLPGVDWRFDIAVSDAEHPGAVRRITEVEVMLAINASIPSIA